MLENGVLTWSRDGVYPLGAAPSTFPFCCHKAPYHCPASTFLALVGTGAILTPSLYKNRQHPLVKESCRESQSRIPHRDRHRGPTFPLDPNPQAGLEPGLSDAIRVGSGDPRMVQSNRAQHPQRGGWVRVFVLRSSGRRSSREAWLAGE